MGISADATLFYGYCWSESTDEMDQFQESDEDPGIMETWTKKILAKRGIQDPYDVHGFDEIFTPKDPKTWQRNIKPEYEDLIHKWWADGKAVKQEFGVDFGHYGGSEWFSPTLQVVETVVHCWSGFQLIEGVLLIHPDWDDKLNRFIEEVELDMGGAVGPGWYMTSYLSY